MKETLLIALASAAVGGVVGALAGSSMSDRGDAAGVPASEKTLAAAVDSALGRRLAELQREVSGLRADLAAARQPAAVREAAAPAAEAPPAEAVARAPGESVADAALRAIARLGERRDARGAEATFGRGADDPDAPRARPDRAKALHRWRETEDVRTKWLFVRERAALEWFGTPGRISHDKDDGSETWYYEWVVVPDQDGDGEPEDTQEIGLTFRGGRLVGVDDFDDD